MWRLASELLCQLSKQRTVHYNVIIELEARVIFIHSASVSIIMMIIKYNDTRKMSFRGKKARPNTTKPFII